MSFARNLKQLRNSKNLTLSALAEISGVSVPQIHKYEKGENSPGTENLKKLAHALGVTTDALTGETPPPIVADLGAEYAAAEEPIRRAIDELLKVPADKRWEAFVRLQDTLRPLAGKGEEEEGE